MTLRFRRWLLASALIVGALIMLAVAGGALLLRTDPGRALLAGMIADAAGTPGVTVVAIGRLDGALPAEIVLSGVTVADRDGVWLTLDHARLVWRPWEMLRKRLSIRLLSVDGLDIARAPAADATGATAGPTPLPREIVLPRLPLDIRLAAFDLDRVSLGAPLLGEAVALRASGRFGADASGGARGHATVERTDGAALQASLEAALEAPTRTLDIDLKIAEPAGGMVARLADLPDLPAVSLSLKGRGPADAWHGRLVVEAQGLAALNADVALALGDRPTLGLAGSAEIAGLADAGVIDKDMLALAGPAPQFDIALALTDDDLLRVERARLTGAAVEADVAGTLDMATLASDLAVTAQLTDPAVVGRFADGVTLGAASLDATLKGPPDALSVAGHVTADRISAGGITLARITGMFDGAVKPQSVSARIGATASGLAGAEPAYAALPRQLDLAGDLALDLAGQTVALNDLKVTGDGVGIAGSGRVDLVGGDVALDATATLDRIAPLTAIVGIDLTGRADATVALTGHGFGETANGSLSVRLADLASKDLPLAPTVGNAATLTATIAGASSGGIALSDFALDGANLKATGKLDIGDGWQTVDLAATLRGHDLARWRDYTGVALTGGLSADVAVRGGLADPSAHLGVDLDKVSVEGVGPLDGRVDVTARALASAPTGDLSAKLTGPAGPVEATTAFALTGGDRLTLDGVRLGVVGARATGALALDLASGLADGTLDVVADDLAPVGDVAGTPLRGKASATLKFAGKRGDQTATLDLSAPSLTLVQTDGGVVLSGATLSARLDGLTPEPKLHAALKVARATSGAMALTNLAVTVGGTPAKLSFDLKGGGTLPAPVEIAAAGSVGQADGGWTVTLDRLSGSVVERPLKLTGPVTASATPAALKVSPFDLAFGEGRITGDATLVDRHVAAKLDVATLPLAIFAAFDQAAPHLGGTLSLQASLDGDAAAPDGSVALQLANVSARGIEAANAVALHGDATAKLVAGRLALHADLGGFSERGMVLDGEVPMRLSLQPFAASLPPDGAIAGTLDWQGEVSTLWEALPFYGHHLSGQADISAKASGTVADPSATGRLRFTAGRYENLDIGTVIDRLTVDATVDAGRVLTVELSGTDGGTGTLHGKGKITLDPLAAFPTDVDLKFNGATLVRRDELTLSANGDLVFAGDAKAMTLEGRIETTRVEARLDTSLPPSVVSLDVVDSKQTAEEKAKAKADLMSPLTLGLDIVVPGQAFVRGRGLDSEWRGNLRVSGNAAAPAIAGTLSFVRGQFTFAGKRFTLDDSTITFDGSTVVDPLLDVRAAYTADDVTALILISGRASNPRLSLSSTPSLPQDEVLSRVLFGKGAGSLSPVEALQLAAAVAQLSGQGPSGAGILDKVRDALGVDVLEVGATDDGNGASLRAGRYIDDRTFVGVTQGTQPGTTGVTIEIEVLPHVSVDTQVDQAGTSKSGVKWKWDY